MLFEKRRKIPENKRRKNRFHTNLQDFARSRAVNWRDEDKILRPEQNITGRRDPFQLSRERTLCN